MDNSNLSDSARAVNPAEAESDVRDSLRRIAVALEALSGMVADVKPLAVPILAALAPRPPETTTQYVTLSQAAILVRRSVETLRKVKRHMPPPAICGGGRGTPDEWAWDELRPWLEHHFGRTLPQRLPTFAE